MLSMLLAYNAAGEIVATLEHMVAREAGEVIGLIDFAAHEQAGGKLRDIWNASDAVGSGTWPEWIGARAHDFTVEIDGGRIVALIHKESGHRRERAVIEAAVAKRITDAKGESVDLRDLLGGPNRALLLDEKGRTQVRSPQSGSPVHLPIIGRGRG